MRDPSASVESPPLYPTSTFTLPDADLVRAAWIDLPPGAAFPTRPDKAKSVSVAMLALGVAVLWFAPVGGVFLLVAGGLGLAIASEAPADISSTNT